MDFEACLFAGSGVMFVVERPYAFFGILLIVPAAVIAVLRYNAICKRIGVSASKKGYNAVFFLRTAFRSVSWIMLVLAYAGVSWGTYRVPVQKSGNAVSFVFDISYSMNADDGAGGMTRLRSAAGYADMLLSKMDDISVSVVLAKGEGVLAIPLTEDSASVAAILPVLSPSLMTAPGSSLGAGIMTALRSFPSGNAQAAHIWVFTDGDETDGNFSRALDECKRHGVSVAVVGFGGTKETAVISGDGKTPVMTALRAAQLERYADENVMFVNSSEQGSAIKLLDTLRIAVLPDGSQGTPVVYETQPVPRFKLFLLLAILFFVVSFVAGDFYAMLNMLRAKKITVLLCFCSFLFVSCGANFDGAKEIFFGAWNYQQRNYQEAAGHFLRATIDLDAESQVKHYAVYGLATTYFAAHEHEAAAVRLSQIPPSAPAKIRYAALYEQGVIAYYGGDYDRAAEFFIDALKIDSSQVDAKINLELAIGQLRLRDVRAHEQELNPAGQSENKSSTMEHTIFERIRENDIQRWKNSEQTTTPTDVLDY